MNSGDITQYTQNQFKNSYPKHELYPGSYHCIRWSKRLATEAANKMIKIQKLYCVELTHHTELV